MLKKFLIDNTLNEKNQVKRLIIKREYKWFIDNNFEPLLNELMLKTDFLTTNNPTISERIYCILNDVLCLPQCICTHNRIFENFSKGYRLYCSVKCRANSKVWQNDVKTTVIKKYGVSHISKLDEVKIKKVETCLRNHGFINGILKYNSYSTIEDKSLKSKRCMRIYQNKIGYAGNPSYSIKGIENRIKNKQMIDPKLSDDYRIYFNAVTRATNLTIKTAEIFNIELRSNEYHLDHKFSIFHGFLNYIPAFIIGSIYNLQIITQQDNCSKNKNSHITLETLLEEFYAQ